MNVLHVVSVFFSLRYFIGGQFLYFKKKGYNMHVVCSPSEYLSNYAKECGFSYMETPITRSISLLEDIKAIKNICRYIKNNQIDIIVGHSPKGAMVAMIAGWLCSVPKRIYFRHGLVYETSKGLKRQMLIMVDRLTSFFATKIVCVSPSVLNKSIEDKLAPVNKQIILAKGTCNGIDIQKQFNPCIIDKDKLYSLRLKYDISENDFIIGYSGRLVKDKGIIELINAFESLADNERCKLLLVGVFEERDALPENVRQHILEDKRIIYTGFINGGMEYYYSLMNVYVLPSYREGFPTGSLEAQAMEVPVITTHVTGCCDSIIQNKTGLFVSHDSKDIAEKIDEIRINHSISGKEGRKWVVDNFDSNIIWREIEKIYIE